MKGSEMKCGFCRFTVPNDALICGHCHADFTYKIHYSELIFLVPLWLVLGFIGAAFISHFLGEMGFKNAIVIVVILVEFFAVKEAIKRSTYAYADKHGRIVECECD